jgi:hypothetical protein
MDSSIHQSAMQLLHRVCTPHGFTAAPLAEDNYLRVWTRDAVICGLASLLAVEERLIAGFKASLQTIWQHQHATGFLPSNVDIANDSVSYGGTVGRADTASWAIIGLCIYARETKDDSFVQTYATAVEKAFALMDAWEFNGKHLLYIPQSADWADEYIQHGYILFDQLLRLWALQLAAVTFNQPVFAAKAAAVRRVIQQNFFYREGTENWYTPGMQHQSLHAPRSFWWMGFNPSQIYPQFDLQANALALLLEIGDAEQNRLLFGTLKQMIGEQPAMLPSFSPAITDADWQMEELKNNYAYRFRNLPHEFHNGMAGSVQPYNYIHKQGCTIPCKKHYLTR